MNFSLAFFFVCGFLVISCNAGAIKDTSSALLLDEPQSDAPAASEVDELRRNLTELTDAYNALCQEIYHLSRHVIFHEHALRHIALSSHSKQGGHGGHAYGGHSVPVQHHHHRHASESADANHTHAVDPHVHSGHTHGTAPLVRSVAIRAVHPDAELIDSAKTGSFNPFARLQSAGAHDHEDDHAHGHGHGHGDVHHDEHHDDHVHGSESTEVPVVHATEKGHDHSGHKDDHSDEEHGCQSNGTTKWQCSLLHQHSCHTGHHEEASNKSFAEQYQAWFKSLTSHERGPSLNISTSAAGASPHHHYHHHEQHPVHENAVEDEHDHGHGPATAKPVGAHDHHEDHSDHGHQHMVQPSDKVLEEMEESLQDADMTYATCDIQPNRHISLILQENVSGRINLWQRSDGNGPLFMYLKLSGFRVGSSSTSVERTRQVRESIIIPVEEPLDEQSQPMYSLDHGFHVHVNGNLSRDCQNTGLHYNPTKALHGGPMDAIRHVGDLGNIRCDANGEIDAEYSYPKVQLNGQFSIIGRSLVIHGQADDFGRGDSEASTSSGNSGSKIACCVITKVAQLPSMPDSSSSLNPIRAPSSRSPVYNDEMERED